MFYVCILISPTKFISDLFYNADTNQKWCVNFRSGVMIWWNLELKGDRVSLIRAVDYVTRISRGAVFDWFRMWRGARGSMNELMGVWNTTSWRNCVCVISFFGWVSGVDPMRCLLKSRSWLIMPSPTSIYSLRHGSRYLLKLAWVNYSLVPIVS